MIRIIEDVKTVIKNDPSCKGFFEVLLTNNGIRALFSHRVAHWFYSKHFYLISSIITRHSVRKNGIEIHAGATLGRRVFIDHGLGVVIGETAVVGDDVKIFQGVTLGGRGKENGKRHPTIENGVLIGAGAKVLGNITIGENSKIGAGTVVLTSVPQNSTVVGEKGKIIYYNKE